MTARDDHLEAIGRANLNALGDCRCIYRVEMEAGDITLLEKVEENPLCPVHGDPLKRIGEAVLNKADQTGRDRDLGACLICGADHGEYHADGCEVATHLDSTPDDADSFLADNECPDCQLPLVDVTEHSDERLRLVCPKCNEEYRKPRSTSAQEEADRE